MAPIPKWRVKVQKENGVKIALWERGFSPLRWPPPRHLRGFRPCAGAGGDVVSSSYLQSPRMAGGRHVPALGSARAEAEASWLVSKPAALGSWARLGLARPDDRTGRSWAALLGEPLDSAGEFGGRDMVHLWRGSRLADDDAARLERPIRRRLTPTRRRAEETGSWAGWASRLSRSRAAVPSCVCENLILFCPIELEVLLKFLENSKILYSYNYINLASDRPRMRRMHERMPSSKSSRRLRPCHRCDARARVRCC